MRSAAQAPPDELARADGDPVDAGHEDSTAVAWHALGVEAVLERLGSGARGLTSTQAAQRLITYGPNSLRVIPPVSAWRILAAQFRSVVVALLAAATLV